MLNVSTRYRPGVYVGAFAYISDGAEVGEGSQIYPHAYIGEGVKIGKNSPEDIFTLGSYLSRDQYGDTPLLYGQAYTSQVALEADGNMCKPVTKEGAPVYQRKEKASTDEKDSYFVVSHKNKYVSLCPEYALPTYAQFGSCTQAYEDWMGNEGNQVPYDRCGENMMVKVPTQMENIRFFLSYQCNFMYWRLHVELCRTAERYPGQR